MAKFKFKAKGTRKVFTVEAMDVAQAKRFFLDDNVVINKVGGRLPKKEYAVVFESLDGRVVPFSRNITKGEAERKVMEFEKSDERDRSLGASIPAGHYIIKKVKIE